MDNGADILRRLAERVTKAAAQPENIHKRRLWSDCNNLRPQRPVVFADPQNGWPELVPEDCLENTDPFLRGIERTLRRTVFRIEHIPDDYPVPDTLYVDLVVNNTGYGLEERVTRAGQSDGAYHIEPSVASFADIERLRPAELTIDRALTGERLQAARHILGDILPVTVKGVDTCRCGLTRRLIHMRGLENMYYDMYDSPELVHRLMSFLRDQQLREYEFLEREGALFANNRPDYITGSGGLCYGTNLPETGTVGMRDMVVWGESQELSSVSPEQFEEFVFAYQKPVLERFGMVDYGCCEPLDQRFGLLITSLPTLRWLAVSPWCDLKKAAEMIGNRYVYVYKPNPSFICGVQYDLDAAERQLAGTLDIARRCAVQISMKDTSTFHGDPTRLTRWVNMALSLAEKGA